MTFTDQAVTMATEPEIHQRLDHSTHNRLDFRLEPCETKLLFIFDL